MLNGFLPCAVAGSVLGLLAGLGAGGGSLLILWLTVVLGMPYPEARILNLLFFLPAALISCLFKIKQGTLPLKKVLPGMLSGVIAAVLFSLLSRVIDTTLLKKLFGGLLLLTGTRELFYRPRKAK